MGKASSAKKIQRVQRAGVSKSPGQRRPLGFPLAIIGIIVVGTVLIVLARDSKQSADAEEPVANRDHWHSAFGVYECGEFLPNLNDSGQGGHEIHTHGDGLIHIHPATQAASGRNATFSVFADAVGMTLEEGKVTLPAASGGQVLEDGGTCEVDGKEKEAELKMLLWPPQATDNVEPEVITRNFGDVRFTEDGQVLVIALVPKGTKTDEIDLPPSVEQLQNPLEFEDGGNAPATQSTEVPVATELPVSPDGAASTPDGSAPVSSVPAPAADGTATTQAPG